MNIQVNGETQEVAAGLTASGLLKKLGLEGKRVVVELNREVIPRDMVDVTELCEGDQIEILHLVGGG